MFVIRESVVTRFIRHKIDLGFVFFSQIKRKKRYATRPILKDLELIFNPEWYKQTYFVRDLNPVVWDGKSLFASFLVKGIGSDRDPHPLFDSGWYCRRYLGGSRSISPIVDYLTTGWKEGRIPNLYFDTEWYRHTYVEDQNINPLLHYIQFGDQLRLRPTPLFDLEWYLGQVPESETFPGGPFAHFCRIGAISIDRPTPFFDSRWYLDQNADVKAANVPPFQHYVTYGGREQRSPHPLFDARYYMRSSDVQDSEMEPLQHFMTIGQAEGLRPHPLFDTKWYREMHILDEHEAQSPLVHYLRTGAAAGYDPNPYFDSKWYVSQHETLEKDKQNPLIHYIMHGVEEGRDPSPSFDTDAYIAETPAIVEKGLNPLSHFIESELDVDKHVAGAAPGSSRCPVMQVPYQILKTPTLTADDDVCVFVSYSRDGFLSAHLSYYLEAIRDAGMKIVLVLVTDGVSQRIEPPPFLAGLIIRSNHGWDFAAWAGALTIFPSLWRCRSLLMANDSVFGPISASAFSKVMTRVQTSDAEVVALTDSFEIKHHLMSYFMALTSKGLKSDSVRRFWEHIESIKHKQDVIDQYEVNGLASWENGAVLCKVLFPSERYKVCNPTLAQWRDLVGRGFPFLKVQLLRDGFMPPDSNWEKLLRGNDTLLQKIRAHLDASSRKTTDLYYRPVPPPWRRFKRDAALTTFYGSIKGTRPTDATDFALEIPFALPAAHHAMRVAVVAHIFYDDLADELCTYIGNIPGPVDVFISTDSEAKKASIERSFEVHESGIVDVRIMPNRGRDVAPMLVGFKDIFSAHDILLHIHSKKSPHGSEFAGWREFLLRNLLGSPEIVSSIFGLLARKDMGVVFSQHFKPVRPVLNWGSNFAAVKGLLAPHGIKLRKDMMLDFPSSSFFWAKTDALKGLLDANLSWSDFAEEAGQVDGTLAHAIERSILYFAEARGYRWCKVGTLETGEPSTLIPVVSDQLDQYVSIAHRALLYNSMPSFRVKKPSPEITRVCVGRDPSVKPRINLVIPSLNKIHFFGGTSTAVKIFEEIKKAAHGFDFRIVSTTVPLDMESMRRFPDWRLEVAGVQTDDFEQTIVDLSTEERGTLSVRVNDVFMATAWWTADIAIRVRHIQKSFFGQQMPLLYLIQDHETHFYPWSEPYALAEATYREDDTIAIVNSEELSWYFDKRYRFSAAFTLPYSGNAEIQRSIAAVPKERIILFYGRPSVVRNLFNIVCAGISLWQQSDPVRASDWTVISVGEAYPKYQAGAIQNLQVYGKLDLNQYAGLLSKASVGISLMLSPHPSYPPLEMAAAAIETITNGFTDKDLRRRVETIQSLDYLTAEHLAEALEHAVNKVEARIGQSFEQVRIHDIPSCYPNYESAKIVNLIRARCKEIE